MSYCIAQVTIFNILLQPITEKNLKKNIYIYIYKMKIKNVNRPVVSYSL